MTVCGGPPATGRKAVPARVGMTGPLGSEDPQGSVPFSEDPPATSSPSDGSAPRPEPTLTSPRPACVASDPEGVRCLWLLPAR